VKWVVVAVVELVEELDELVAPAGFDPEIVDVKVVALGRQRYQSHSSLLCEVI
jgi:Tfp pilus assembly PilM family ATPase